MESLSLLTADKIDKKGRLKPTKQIGLAAIKRVSMQWARNLMVILFLSTVLAPAAMGQTLETHWVDNLAEDGNGNPQIFNEQFIDRDIAGIRVTFRDAADNPINVTDASFINSVKVYGTITGFHNFLHRSSTNNDIHVVELDPVNNPFAVGERVFISIDRNLQNNGGGTMGAPFMAAFRVRSTQSTPGSWGFTILDQENNPTIDGLTTGTAISPGVTVADFNEDGLPDIAYGTSASDNTKRKLVVYINQGGGLFDAGQATVSSNPGFASELAAGDFNNDGHIDIAVLSPDRLDIYSNDGGNSGDPSRSFTRIATILSDLTGGGLHNEMSDIRTADMDGDGAIDILISQGKNDIVQERVAVLRNTGNFTFSIEFAPGDNREFGTATMGDFDNDGFLDVYGVYSGLDGSVSDIAFGFTDDSQSNITFDDIFSDRLELSRIFHSGDINNNVDVGDLNGDGLLDMVFAQLTNKTMFVKLPTPSEINVLKTSNNPTDIHTETIDFSTLGFETGNFLDTKVADIDGDGLLDIISGFEQGFAVLRTIGNSSSTDIENEFLAKLPRSRMEAISFADFDNDGDLDLVTVQNSQIDGTVTNGPGFAIFGTNSPPRITGLTPSSTYTEDNPPLVLNSSATISEPEGDPITELKVSIIDNFVTEEDVLDVDLTGLGLSKSYNSNTGVLTISGSASAATYTTALQRVTYRNSDTATPLETTKTIEYVASNTNGNTFPETTSLTVVAVNGTPTTLSESFTMVRNTTLDVAFPGVLGNDTDEEKDDLTAILADSPANTSAFTLNSDGSFSLTPTTNFTGDITFTYRASDGNTSSPKETVTVSVTTTNDAPTANDDNNITLLEDGFVDIDVLANDSDPNGDALSPLIMDSPTNGTATVNPDGTIKYTPGTNFNGTDSFTYRASDGSAVSSTDAVVSITVNPVNDKPTFTTGPDIFLDQGDGPQTINGWAKSINDGDPEANQALTFNLATDNDAAFSTLPAIDPSTGNLTFTPALDGFGKITVTVTLSDNGGTANGGVNTSDPQTFTITIFPNLQIDPGPPPQTKLDIKFGQNGRLLGSSAAIRGDVAVLGAPKYDPDGDNFNNGAAFVFEFNGNKWEEVQMLSDVTPENLERFGTDVAISESGRWLVIGDDANNGSSSFEGAVFVYERINGVWTLRQTLRPSDGPGRNSSGDEFGQRIDISENRIVVGSPILDARSRNGRAYVFDFDGTSWNETAILFASDQTGDDETHEFASDVAVDGNRIVIGAEKVDNDANSNDEGAVYVFDFDGANWNETAILRPTAGEESSTTNMGSSVDLEGDLLITGAPQSGTSNEGDVFFFRFDPASNSWNREPFNISGVTGAGTSLQFGTDVVLQNSQAMVGAPTFDSPEGIKTGAGFALTFNGTEWVQADIFFPFGSLDAGIDDGGRSLAFDSDRVLLGAPGHDLDIFGDPLLDSGAGYVITDINTAASIVTAIPDQVTDEDTPISINFEVQDGQQSAGSLTVTATSSNQTLVPDNNITVTAGAGGDRTLEITPAANQFGMTTITVSISDGILFTNETFLLDVNPINDAPLLANIESTELTYLNFTNPVNITGTLTVSDVDETIGTPPPSHPTTDSAHVIITNFEPGHDLLQIDPTGTLPSGLTASFDDVSGRLTITGEAAPADYQTALQLVQYVNTRTLAENPIVNDRTITFQAFDNPESNIEQRIISFDDTGVSQAPILSNMESTSLVYNPGSSALTVSNEIRVSDADSPQLASATISIVSNYEQGEDALSLKPSANPGGISDAFNSQTGVLTLTGNATLAEYEQMLQAITYQNTNTVNPSTIPRVIRFQVTDTEANVSNLPEREIIFDGPILFKNQMFGVNTDVPNGHLVGKIHIIPESNNLTYTKVSGDEDGIFAIDPNSGDITVAKTELLDGSQTEFIITVDVSDGSNATTGEITIGVSTTNNPPVSFSEQEYSILDNVANGFSVGTIVARDPDGDPLSFTVLAENQVAGSNVFNVDNSTGEITVADASQLDASIEPLYELIVKIGDGDLFTSKHIRIFVSGSNNPPTIVEGQTFDVSEDQAVGLPVNFVDATVDASDPDSEPLQFEILDGNEGDLFAIDSGTGELTVASPLNFEIQQQSRLLIRVRDGGNGVLADTLSRTEEVVINIQDVNEPPVITAGQQFAVNETAEAGAFVGKVFATDPEGVALNYFIIGENPDKGPRFFVIDQNGIITLTADAQLDAATDPVFSLTVQVDDGVDVVSRIVNVDIVPETGNQAPVLPDGQVFAIREGVPDGTVIDTVSFSDPEDDALAFSMLNISPGPQDIFTIDNNGIITLADANLLDADAVPVYELLVKLEETGTAEQYTQSGVITIDVSRKNRGPEIPENQLFSVSENDPFGTNVGTVSANDFEGGNLTFNIISGQENEEFSIDNNGVVKINNPVAVDFESRLVNGVPEPFRLLIEVTDDGNPNLSDTEFIEIDVTDEIEALELITNEGLSVPRGNTQFITMVKLELSDPDNTPDELVYTLESVVANGLMILNPGPTADTLDQVGDTFTQADINNSLLSYEHAGGPDTGDSFTFMASDPTGNTIPTTIFDITVTDGNQPPVLVTNNGLSILVGTTKTIGQELLEVTDPDDLADVLVYTLVTGTTDGNLRRGALNLSAGSTFTQEDINRGVISYESVFGNPDSFSFTVDDPAGNMITETTFTISNNSTNTAPSIINNELLTLVIGEERTISKSELLTEDVESIPSDITYTIRSGGAPQNGMILQNGLELLEGDTFTQKDINDGLIFYRSEGNTSGPDSFLFDVADSDGGSISNQQFDIQVNTLNADNSTPQLVVNAPLDINQGETKTIGPGLLEFSDVDHSAENLTYTLDLLPDKGILLLNGTQITSTAQTFTQADINDGLLRYRHTSGNSLAETDFFVFDVTDGSGASTGLNKFDIGINGAETSPNDPPIVTAPSTISVDEEQTFTFTSGTNSEISVSDIDAGDNNVQITLSLPDGSGTMTLAATTGLSFTIGDGTGDTDMLFRGTLTDINNALDGLQLILQTNATADFNLNVTANDQGNTGSGSAEEDSKSIFVNVNEINDDPVIVAPANPFTTQNTDLVFGPGDITVSDPDAGSSEILMDMTITSGTATLASTTGLSFTTGDGTDDASMSFAGTLNDINAALDGMIYTPTTDFTGTAAIDLTVNDQGNTGTGGGGDILANISIDVLGDEAGVNDPPNIKAPATASTKINQPHTFGTGEINIVDLDIDQGDLELTLSVDPLEGTLSLATTTNLTFSQGNGTDDATIIATGPLVDINNALEGLVFTPVTDFSGIANIDITADDQGNTGTGGALQDMEIIAMDVSGSTADPTNSTITLTPASPDTVLNDGQAFSIVTVQLKDNSGVNLTTGGDKVELFTSLGTLSGVIDNGDGTYTDTLRSTQAGEAEVRGQLNDVNMTNRATVNFGGVADPASAVITANPSQITNNGASTSTITVQLRDNAGNDLTASGGTVTLATTAGSLSSVTDNGDGTYTATLTSSTIQETATITGTLDGVAITDGATVDFTPAPIVADPVTSEITASPTTIAADGSSTSTITVQLKDAGGSNITTGGDAVELSTTAGTLSGVTDNGDGTYTAVLTASTIQETATISGTVNGSLIQNSAQVVFKGQADATQSIITLTPSLPDTLANDGNAFAVVSVQLKDAGGKNINSGGDAVVLSTTIGTLSGITDNGDGTYTDTLRSTQAGLATVTGTLNGAGMTSKSSVNFGGVADPASAIITANPSQITNDGASTSTITVQLRDNGGSDLTQSGGTVALSTTAGTLSGVTDNGDGTYTATLTSSTIQETATITGTLDGAAITDDATVEFTPSPVVADETTSIIMADPISIAADGASTSTITVQLKDSGGNNLNTGGDEVELITSAGTFSDGSTKIMAIDNGDGTYTETLTSTLNPQVAQINGTVNGKLIDNGTEVAFIGQADPTQSLITADPTQILNDGNSTSTITVELRDNSGSPISSGQTTNTIVLTTSAGTFSNGQGTITLTGTAATFNATLTSTTVVETATITATLNAVNVTDNATVDFVSNPVTVDPTLTIITANPTSIPADGASTSIITVQLVDNQGNNITSGGPSIELTTSLGTFPGGVTTIQANDNNDGTYSAVLTSSINIGTATITGKVNGNTIADDATVNFILSDIIIAGQEFGVREGTPNGTEIGLVSAFEPNGGDLRFAVVSGNTQNIFAIDATTGALMLVGTSRLDAAAQPMHTLTVEVRDNADNLLDREDIVIHVSSQNEPGKITGSSNFSQIFSINANSASDGDLVGRVSFFDPDTNPGTFSILEGNTNNAFNLDPVTGDITVADRNQLTVPEAPTEIPIAPSSIESGDIVPGQTQLTSADFEFKLTIILDDGGPDDLADTKTVFIQVSQDNAPPIISTNNLTIEENTVNGTIVDRIELADTDVGQTHSFSLLSENGSMPQTFSIDPGNGDIFIADSMALDFESVLNPFELMVQVQDNGSDTGKDKSLFMTKTITIDLTDINEVPVLGDLTITIDEGTPNGTIIGQLQATDPDFNEVLSYSIIGGNDSGAFALDATSGELSINDESLIDFELRTQYVLTVQSSDDGQPQLSDPGTVVVNINNVNDRPILSDISPDTVILNSITPVSTTIAGEVTVTDADDDSLVSARVELNGNFIVTQERLTFEEIGDITGTYDETTGVISFTGRASLSDYEQVLRTVNYEITSTDLELSGERNIGYTVNDGQTDSEVASRTISFFTISKYVLNDNYPNPFNPVTTIEYELPLQSRVVLEVYNILGQKIVTLVNEVQEAGAQSVIFNTSQFNLASGVYFYRIGAVANDESGIRFTKTKKMILIK